MAIKLTFVFCWMLLRLEFRGQHHTTDPILQKDACTCSCLKFDDIQSKGHPIRKNEQLLMYKSHLNLQSIQHDVHIMMQDTTACKLQAHTYMTKMF